MADHDHGVEIDWGAHGPLLERQAEVHTSLNATAVQWLRSQAGAGGDEVRLVVDVGAGPGVITCLLAEVFPSARVIALDSSSELLDRTATRAARTGFEDRVEVRRVDLPDGFEGLDLASTADIVWASHVLHHLGDQQDALRQMGALLRPGGLLGIAEGGLPMRTLPRDIGFGRPGLESRLDAADEAWFAEMRGALPGATPTVEHWPGLLAAAGLVPAGSRTFLLDLPAPLHGDARELVRHRFERAKEALATHLDVDDLAAIDRLLAAQDHHSLDHRADVFVLTATTVHLASAPAG